MTSTLTDMTSTSTTRAPFALLVDDHPLFRKGLKEFLESETDFRNCTEAESVEGAIDSFTKFKPDLVTVDISLGNENGLHLVERLRQLDKETPILAISMHREEFYQRRTFEAGGNGYVCKQSSYEDILQAVNAVRQQKNYLSNANDNSTGHHKIKTQSGEVTLSSRESQILGYIGDGNTTQAIANKLGLAATTVETYRERIKTKLKLANSLELHRFAILWRLDNP